MNERPSAIEFIKNASLEQRTKENQVRTEEITRKLVNSSGLFGGDIEEERSEQICQEVLGVFGAGYKSVESMNNTLKNPSSTDKQKGIAKENLTVLGKSVFIAMNKTFANYSEEATETITSQLAAEDIDGLVPKKLRGIGKYVKEADDKSTDEEKKNAKFEIIKVVEVSDTLKNAADSLSEISSSLSKGTISTLLGLEESDDLSDKLSSESTNPELSNELKAIKRKNFNKGSYSQLKEAEVVEQLRKSGIEGIYEKIEFIERGQSSVDDLTRNSEYFRYIYMIANGKYDDILKKMSFKGKELGLPGVELLKKEINMRMFLHNSYLASSKCHSIEDILRVVGSLHEGDLDHSLDREFVKFFLNGKMGLKELPINEAWDWRQKGYFQIGEVKREIDKNKKDFLSYLNAKVDDNNQATKGNDAARKRIGVDIVEEYHVAESTGVWGDNIEIKADKDYGIEENILKNFFQIESGGKIEAKIIQEYMLWKIKQSSGCSDEEALKAYELTKKFSVATFADSKANIGFAADDYAEMILFKLFRYTDSITKSKSRERKSKPIGSPRTVRHIETLVCHWLDLSRKDSVELRSIYNPLFSDQINFEDIVGNSDMAYHFSSIVATQVIPIKEFFTEKITPKDVGGINTISKIYAKINKLSYDLCRAGIKPIYFGDKKNDEEVYVKNSKGLNKINQLSERKVAEKMRKIWAMNLFYLMGNNSSGWSSLDTEVLIKSLLRNDQLIQDNKLPGGSFIPREELFKLIDSTKVRRTVLDNDIERKRSKGINTY